MRYERELSMHCDAGCGRADRVLGGAVVERVDWHGNSMTVTIASTDAISVTDAASYMLAHGWVGFTLRDIAGEFERFTEPLAKLPRGLAMVCPDCAPTFEPGLSASASRQLAEVTEAQRSLMAENEVLRREVDRLRQLHS